MDKNTRYILLALAGGVGVYIIWKGEYLQQWFPSLFAATVPSTTGNSGSAGTPAQIAAAQAAAKAASDLAAANAAGNAAAVAAAQQAAANAAAAKATADAQAAAIAAAAKVASDAAAKAAAVVSTNPSANPCPAGQLLYNGQCVPVGSSANDTLTKIATAAGSSGPLLNMDQWCYFAAQVGVTCPDPGSIDPDLYAGAWGPGTDRTTPIAADTFWYLATQTDPSLKGLRGMQALSGFLT